VTARQLSNLVVWEGADEVVETTDDRESPWTRRLQRIFGFGVSAGDEELQQPNG
jgi:hypothetical protein